MSTILKSFEKTIENKLEIEGNTYIAIISQAEICNSNIYASLRLDRLDGKKKISHWKPKFKNFFYTETEYIDNKTKEFQINRIKINRNHFKELANEINNILANGMDSYDSNRQTRVIEYNYLYNLFSKAYYYYNEFIKPIK